MRSSLRYALVSIVPVLSFAQGGRVFNHRRSDCSSVDASLIPPFGISAGVSANDGTANCVGDNAAAIPSVMSN